MASRQDRLERGGAAPADERVGILAGGHRGDTDPDAVAEQLVAGAEGGAEAGLVAVVEQDRGGREAAEQRGLVRGERSAERCHHVLDAGEDQPEHVEVALDQDDGLFLPDGALGLVQVVELAALVEDLVLGRVEILGLAGPQEPAAEAAGPAAQIVDREQQARPEAGHDAPVVARAATPASSSTASSRPSSFIAARKALPGGA